jgi:hypothetical protein
MKSPWITLVLVLLSSACISSTRYVCYDKTVVEDKNLCPNYACMDGSVVATPEACPTPEHPGKQPESKTSTTISVSYETLPPLPSLLEEGPGIYYRAYHTIIMLGDFESWLGYLSSEYRNELNDTTNALIHFQKKKSETPKNITIIREHVYADSALVEVKGSGKMMAIGDETKMTGEIRMVKEEGAWKVHRENWRPEVTSSEDIWGVENHCNNLEDIDKCNEIAAADRDKCVSCFSKLIDKPGLCEGVTSLDVRDDCYTYFALNTGNVGYCQRLSTPRKMEDCINTIK